MLYLTTRTPSLNSVNKATFGSSLSVVSVASATVGPVASGIVGRRSYSNNSRVKSR